MSEQENRAYEQESIAGDSEISAGQLAWAIRAVQLDLPRHMETVKYIHSYTDLAAEAGFNTLVVYFEARVRTRSFAFRPRQETYSLDEMARVVEPGRGAGMDVVPIVSTLGHCEQFLACKRLAPYEKLGFDALLCPASSQPRNGATFTGYARRHKVLGGLLT